MSPEKEISSIRGNSPWFARNAEERLAAGDAAEAARICTEGLVRYPWYATGMLILGRCYEALGRTADAVVEFRKGLRIHPDGGVLRDALVRMEKREREEFNVFAEQQIEMLHGTARTLTFEQYISGKSSEGESTVDFLRQQAARKEEEDNGARTVAEPTSTARIVTETLAEIYASQGEYREAIGAYMVLLERRPNESVRFRKRIEELEILAATEKPLE
jgi:tetratricopeptide (TPR) repeat protein